jgi:hypothetical protein
MALTVTQKREMSRLFGIGHAKYGKVAARHPYRDDDEGGGDSGLPSIVPEHPLLADLPVGAASDLTADVAANSESLEEAKERMPELTPALQAQPQLQAQMKKSYVSAPTLRR